MNIDFRVVGMIALLVAVVGFIAVAVSNDSVEDSETVVVTDTDVADDSDTVGASSDGSETEVAEAPVAPTVVDGQVANSEDVQTEGR